LKVARNENNNLDQPFILVYYFSCTIKKHFFDLSRAKTQILAKKLSLGIFGKASQ
jgi:hypothetical protein